MYTLKLQLLIVAILTLAFSSLSITQITARPSGLLSAKQLIAQTTTTEQAQTIKGEITEIENEVVKVQTPEGQIEDVKISETEQQQLRLKAGNQISVTIKKNSSGEEITEKVMLEGESASTSESIDTNSISTTNGQETIEESTELQTTATTEDSQPVPALW